MELQGHRGFGKLAPFNSIRGFHLAGLTRLHSVEFDIRMLKDKTVIVTHGPELGDGNIEQFNWDEAKKIPIDENDLTKDTGGLLDKSFFPGNSAEFLKKFGDTLTLANQLEK